MRRVGGSKSGKGQVFFLSEKKGRSKGSTKFHSVDRETKTSRSIYTGKEETPLIDHSW